MRKFKRRRYIFAFLITAAIFFLGFFFGFIMDLQRIDYFESISKTQQLNLRSLQLQYELAKNLETEDQCQAFKFMFDKYIIELEQNRERLEIYSKQSKVIKENFDFLRREYVLSQINFWYISQNLRSACSETFDVVTVIYFHSDDEKCPDCEKQSSVLDYYKTQLKQNFLVFAIDEKLGEQEQLIELMKETYNVTAYPTIIINGEFMDDKLVSKETFEKKLCGIYKDEDVRRKICEEN